MIGRGARAARGIAAAVALVALLVGIATARELQVGARALVDSDAALAKGDFVAAVARARDAAEAAAPGSPYPREGLARLEAIGRAAETRGDERTAVHAWGAMRAAATATSGVLGPSAAWVTLADEGVVRAGARPLVPSPEVHAREATLRAALGHEDAPSVAMLVLLGVGGLAFFAGCARIAVAARDADALRRERWAIAAAGLGALIYAVACLRA